MINLSNDFADQNSNNGSLKPAQHRRMLTKHGMPKRRRRQMHRFYPGDSSGSGSGSGIEMQSSKLASQNGPAR